MDTITTPFGHGENVLGGSAVYFAFAALQYTPVRLVAVVGEDFPKEYRDLLASRNIDLTGLEVRRGGKTFRWRARFEGDMNVAETLDTQLNVLGEAGAPVPPSFADSNVVFLANSHPLRQREMLASIRHPRLVVCDTMDLWINTARDELLKTLGVVDGVIINDGEARMLTGKQNLIDAGDALMGMGPKFAVIKKGEHGALLVTKSRPTAIPAYPTRQVVDPTGAGDSFAGGMIGYLSTQPEFDDAALRRGLVRGTIAASFTIEDFSLNRVRDLRKEEVDRRVAMFLAMLRME